VSSPSRITRFEPDIEAVQMLNPSRPPQYSLSSRIPLPLSSSARNRILKWKSVKAELADRSQYTEELSYESGHSRDPTSEVR